MIAVLLAVSGVFAAVAIVLLVLRRCLLLVTVRGPSMEPTYWDGDRVLALRWRRVRRGAVVVVMQPNSDAMLIKRVFAVPGDPVPRENFPALADRPEAEVPADSLVLRGDNAECSRDSAHLGYFSIHRIRAFVVHRIARHETPGIHPG
jgi:signal peptidase I